MRNHLLQLGLILPSLCALAEHPVEFDVQLLAVDTNEGVAVADYDNDGLLDISAGRSWFRNPGKQGIWVGRPVRLIDEHGSFTRSNSEAAYDVNGDGLMDIVASDFFSEPVYWYQNPGNTKLERGELWIPKLFIQTTQKTNENGTLLNFDLYNDGKTEWIANQWNKNAPLLVWHRNENGDFISHTIGQKNGHGIGFGDINNDGREDILVGTGWYERPRGDPYAQAWTYHPDWSRDFSCPMIVRDVNGDGLNDMIWGNPHDYGVFVWLAETHAEGDHAKLQFKEVKLDDSFSQAHAIHMADLDGDGRDELITGKRVRAHDGKDPGSSEEPLIVYYTWDEKFSAIQRHVIAKGCGTGLQIRTADLDKDGDLEIIVAGKDGTQILWNKHK